MVRNLLPSAGSTRAHPLSFFSVNNTTPTTSNTNCVVLALCRLHFLSFAKDNLAFPAIGWFGWQTWLTSHRIYPLAKHSLRGQQIRLTLNSPRCTLKLCNHVNFSSHLNEDLYLLFHKNFNTPSILRRGSFKACRLMNSASKEAVLGSCETAFRTSCYRTSIWNTQTCATRSHFESHDRITW